MSWVAGAAWLTEECCDLIVQAPDEMVTARQGLDAVLVPAPGSPSRMELELCGASACEAAKPFASVGNNAAFYEMSQHLVGVFLEAFTFSKTTQSKKTLKLLKALV